MGKFPWYRRGLSPFFVVLEIRSLRRYGEEAKRSVESIPPPGGSTSGRCGKLCALWKNCTYYDHGRDGLRRFGAILNRMGLPNVPSPRTRPLSLHWASCPNRKPTISSDESKYAPIRTSCSKFSTTSPYPIARAPPSGTPPSVPLASCSSPAPYPLFGQSSSVDSR